MSAETQNPLRDFALKTFAGIKSSSEQDFKSRHGLLLKSGIALDCAVIKLLKSHWTTSPMSVVRNQNGIFFSVWLEQKKPDKPLLRYNVHAKKFREAGHPKIAAREFAGSFRQAARDELKSWPSISYPKGPGTLFEGHVPFIEKTLAADTLRLMQAFAPLALLVDRLLLQG